MKHQKALCWGLILVFIFSACQKAGEGPRSWIDQPLENSVFPLGNIILQAHASDSDGVAVIEFFLEGQTLI
ncbi:MAG TPA: Ig-like domain-containing protein [Pelolinea sp.]|nr:Ig-like domain-containing protein [Pelolinea sp.]